MGILSACRFFLGFGVGVASFIVPLYLSETAPAKIRGSMGTLFQLLITVGIFLISISNVMIARCFTEPRTALALMFLTVTFFAVLMFLGSIILPESPRYLMLKGKKDKAIEVLTKTLNTKEEVDFEIQEIEKTLEKEPGVKIGVIFKGYFLKVLLVGVFLQVFQQLVGINMMIYYAPRIFGYAGIAGLIGMMTVPTVNMLFTFPAIRLVEYWGRKKLLYVGALCMLITMIAAGIAFSGKVQIKQNGIDKLKNKITAIDKLTPLMNNEFSEKDLTIKIKELGFTEIEIKEILNQTDRDATSKTILIISIIVYIFGFAVSWGPVVWLVCSEIFPLEGREVGMTITTMVNWTFAGLVMSNALTFMQVFGNASIFFLFSVFCILSIVFVALVVPETKGITLEQLELNLKSGKKLRDIGYKAE
ncbi:MAG: Galactose-proton symporter [bacterium ADurb.Bin363]|nr:MAG: Galactose-proton symporter [bacterium ADurb.Bin363]